GSWLGTAHRYHIDWNFSNVVYSIDGVVVATHAMAISSGMRPMIADYYVDGKVLAVTGIKMGPYTTSPGTFISRVFDASTTRNWSAASWISTVRAGTTLSIAVRYGNTPVPDGTWTGFIPLGGSGSALSGASRYLQYRAILANTDVTQTPTLNSI